MFEAQREKTKTNTQKHRERQSRVEIIMTFC